MQTMVVDGFLRALADPRFQELVAEFYQVRGTVEIKQADVVREGVRNLLETVQRILEDQYSVLVVGGDTVTSQKLQEAIACVEGVHELAIGPAFEDSVTVLHIFCQKLQLSEIGNDPEQVLTKLDDFLILLGLRDISVAELWRESRGHLDVPHRDDLWTVVKTLLEAVGENCHSAVR